MPQNSNAKVLPGKAEPTKIEEKSKKKRRLKVAHPERCIGCLGCMFACSRIRRGSVSLQDSAIKILTRGGLEGDFMVVVCRGCKDPPCVRACPNGALERKPDGNIVFHEELCAGCGKCEKSCLIGAISLCKDGKPIKCIHCGACVDFCPHDVLKLEEVLA
ncbi:MAG: 4Fe-4S binding protein [Methanotrichaceae archaeon]|nr:4Fe-4S binding protein [Methanotrichaceae archaeon]